MAICSRSWRDDAIGATCLGDGRHVVLTLCQIVMTPPVGSLVCLVRSRFVPEYVHGVHHPTKVLPQSWQVACGPSMAMPLCRHSLCRSGRSARHASRSLCSQEIALMYSSTWQGWSSLHQHDR